MSSFHDILTSKKFISAYGFNDKGILYIEDYPDKDFWQSIVHKHLNNKYNVMCYKCTVPSIKKEEEETELLMRGKRNLEKLFKDVHDKLIIGIDADYDYLLDNNTKYSPYLKNKFILHTYGFSRENILCSRKSILYAFSKITFSIESEFNINIFINKVSVLCYKYLPMFLFHKNNLNEKNFHKLFHMTDELFNMNDTELWNNKKKSFDQFFSNLIFNEDFDIFKQELKDKGFNKYNAYQFINGHTLLNNIIYKMFTYVKNDLNKKETEEIKMTCKGKAIEQRKKQVRNHFSDNCSFKTNINNGLFIDDDKLYLYIVNKALKIRH